MDINATLIGQGLTFFVFILVTMKYVWPNIQKAMAEREQKIADGLAAAEKGKQELEQAEERSQELVNDGKQKASDIIAQAQKRGDEMIEEAKSDARTEAERVKASAQAEIDQEIAKAREKLKTEVAALAIAGAEQILMREVDKSAHNEVLDKVCAKL